MGDLFVNWLVFCIGLYETGHFLIFFIVPVIAFMNCGYVFASSKLQLDRGVAVERSMFALFVAIAGPIITIFAPIFIIWCIGYYLGKRKNAN